MAAVAPLVSVVVPAYNVERYVGHAISSVLAQSEPSFELIVIDDASTDSTRDVVRTFMDPRVRLIETAANRGPSAARNRALEEARGQWVAFLDADDWWAPARLERLLEAGEQSGADMVADDCWLIEDGARRPWGRLLRTRGIRARGPRTINVAEFIEIDLGLTRPVIRRDLLTGHAIAFDESLRVVEDFVFYLSCLLSGGRFVIVPDAYYYYRARPAALTSDRVTVLNVLAAVARRLDEDDRVLADPRIRLAVRNLQRRTARQVRYHEFVRQLKEHRPIRAIQAGARNPGVLVTAALQLPTVLRARVSRHV